MNKIKKNIPNIITISRIISLILGFIFFIKGNTILSLILYIYGAISDFLDGYLARKLNSYTAFGKYLDATSDKLYFLSIILISLIYGTKLVIIPLILEIIISIINIITMIRKKEVHTERIGKIKTTIEFISLILSLLVGKSKILFYSFIILLLLTVYFQIQSIFAYINELHGKENKSYKSKTKNKIISLLDEFKYYLLNPVKIIK